MNERCVQALKLKINGRKTNKVAIDPHYPTGVDDRQYYFFDLPLLKRLIPTDQGKHGVAVPHE